jgi:uncharacterized membrane protein YphA (DoxX/SURF4 family)
MTTLTSPSRAPAGSALRIGLWVAQALLAVVFIGSGVTKFFTPIPDLSQMMPWTGELPMAFVRFIGLVDFAGGVGILLPSLTRVQPRLTVLAALGCTVLQVLAIGFHLSRDEAMVLPLNFVLLPLAAFVLWGRGKRVPISPRP